ncbi:CoA-transferase family III domain-containing protein [Apiosordaria backusii]|uniref:CoA-transferase family III domain-containing protein n=1 Tax=Apiosordaria backusii TaxID=314023 RepID=A0AA40K7D5_9PEZI|nr:CoA-transferase family III domain-containing protein [Apiosordaria backusii]
MNSSPTMLETTPLPSWERQWRDRSKSKRATKPLHKKEVNHVSQQTLLLFSTLRYYLGTLKMDNKQISRAAMKPKPYSVIDGARQALSSLEELCRHELPENFSALAGNVNITSSSGQGNKIHFPTPLKEQDATAAIKGLEARIASAIANLRYGAEKRTVTVDIDKISGFLMSAYLTTIDGMDKTDPGVKERIPDTDLNKAQSILYRRLSANLYSTKIPGEYYHIHGSLNADITLEMLGLPKHRPDLTNYRECINTIEAAVMKHTAAELDTLNLQNRQAGIKAYTWEQFQELPHGKAMCSLPPFTVKPNPLDTTTPPIPFSPSSTSGNQFALSGIKVLELCRIIAGPTIGRSLAAHGAQVIKITCPTLPDVPFFQLDVNTGKHCISLDLKSCPSDREVFSSLLAEADVLIDGYRPGALAKLGYSPAFLAEVAQKRNKGFVYIAEDCFGGTGVEGAEWATRPGWQQIADCVSGVAFAQGKFMGLGEEPVVPPFPMSDYGTGALGSVAALMGIYKRATEGGSWVGRTSLVQYDIYLQKLGLLPEQEQERLRETFKGDGGFFDLRHSDSVDEVGRRALRGMRGVVPFLFDDDDGGKKLMNEGYSKGFGGVVRWPREAVEIEGVRVGHVRVARPNGWDTGREKGGKSLWEGWEEDGIEC